VDARREAEALQSTIAALGTPQRAAGAKRYMRSGLTFTGTTVPAVRRVAAQWLRDHPALTATELRAISEALWAQETFEARLLATVLLQRSAGLLRSADLPWLERLLRDCRGWSLMDNLAPCAVEAVLSRSPSLRRTTLARWSRDDDFWMRRAALLTLHRRLAVDEEEDAWRLWCRLAVDHLEDQRRWRGAPPTPEERFFIRKALGWALRDASQARPADVAAFVRRHRARLSGLTVREATRRLGAADRRAAGP
jgi:3-methyladenine DNA glycosylase AlkD